MAQLATGTPSSAKYLNGDGTWHATSEFAAAGSTISAASISYDHTTSGLAATQVQAAIDELAASLIPTSTTYSITQNTQNWNLIEAIGSTPGAPVTIAISVKQGVLITSSSATTPAMDLTGLPSGSIINLLNLGSIIGLGGDGGQGGGIDAFRVSTDDVCGSSMMGTNGQAGGNAIKGPGSGVTLNITNAAGYIFGGGGGGGGGGVSALGGAATNEAVANAGGGGGGAGGGKGGTGGKCSGGPYVTGIAATLGGTGGHAGVGRSASAGAAGTAGTVQLSGGTAAGATSAAGAGGAYGAAGTAGTANTTYGKQSLNGLGGAAGKAIDVQSGTANFVSGNNVTHVKGAVS